MNGLSDQTIERNHPNGIIKLFLWGLSFTPITIELFCVDVKNLALNSPKSLRIY